MITEAYTSFFKKLAKNNHKEWFHANKKDYEHQVKAPFVELLDQLLADLTEWDPRILADPKNALFRINRDIRFSKDKSPYNTLMKAGFSPLGKKSILPGYYLGIDAENVHVGGGLFMLRGPELKKVRQHIAGNAEALIAIVEHSNFKQNFGKLKGEKSKRLDREFMEIGKATDLIFHKQFYTMAEFPIEPYFDNPQLKDEILSHFEAIKPLNEYLNQAFA
nr:DUF2461 domain-containing protein [Allomuricauda sp.]